MGGTFIAERIKELDKDEGLVIHIYGEIGAGKTSYALYTARCIYNSWDEVLAHLYFDLRDLLKDVRRALVSRTRIPVVILDDAGLWANKISWWERPVRKFTEFFNVIRSVAKAVIMTTPTNEIPSQIERKVVYRVHVIKTDERNAKGVPLSQAVIYRAKVTPDFRRMVKKVAIDIFPRYYPDSVYEAYEKIRRRMIDRKLREIVGSLSEEESPQEGIPRELVECCREVMGNIYSEAIRMIKEGAPYEEVYRFLRRRGLRGQHTRNLISLIKERLVSGDGDGHPLLGIKIYALRFAKTYIKYMHLGKRTWWTEEVRRCFETKLEALRAIGIRTPIPAWIMSPQGGKRKRK